MTSAQNIAKALDKNYRSSGDGYVCRCPAHNDDMPSLKVSDGKEGRILVHCHAGCDPKQVIAEIDARGLWPKLERQDKPGAPRRERPAPPPPANDPFGEAPAEPKAKVKLTEVKRYDYFDHQHGDLVMQVIRYEPKTFKQRRPDPNRPGEWSWSVSAEHRTLYNAPRAFRHDKTILVVEGEKDVDNLAEIGIVAVCNPGGAGKWQDNYSEILRGKDVILVPDNDPQKVNKNTGALMWHPDGRPIHPGQDHADLVGAALQGIASRVRILHLPDLPEKGDISDWLAAGGTRAQLGTLCAAAPDWTPPVAPQREPELPADLQAPPALDGEKPFQCLGYNKGSFFYLPKGQQQVVELSASAHTKGNLIGLADFTWWEMEYPNGDKPGFNLDMAANWMMRTCERRGVWSPAEIRGRGAWWDEGRIVVHCGDMLYVDRTPNAPSSIRSRYVYELGQPMRAAIDNPLSLAEAKLYLDHMQRLPFKRSLDAVLMAGWTVCAHIGGVLSWRPHVWLVGPKGSGKSYVMDRVVKPLFGPERCLAVASSTTEAGLRQSLGTDAIPVLFDEAEGQDAMAVARIQRILETVRQSSSETGAKIAKGTTSGSALSFQIRSCFMFASINASIVQQSDRSRITVVELSQDARKHDLAELNRLGQFLLGDEYAQRYQARAISLAPVVRHNAEIFAAVAAVLFGEQRAGDQYGALMAGAYSLESDSKITVEQAEVWLAQFDLEEDKAEIESMSDEQACLQYLLQQVIKGADITEGKRDLTVGELVECASQVSWDSKDGDRASMARLALARVGMKVSSDAKGLFISNTADGVRRLLKDTPWSTNWAKVMRRLPNARAAGVTYFGYTGSETRAVWVPLPQH